MIIKVGTVIVDVLNEIPSTATILDMNILLLSTLLQCDHLFRVKSAREYGNYVIQLNCVTSTDDAAVPFQLLFITIMLI